MQIIRGLLVRRLCWLLALILAALPLESLADDIEIGVLASLTGNWAFQGDMLVKGAKLAADKVNKEGGISGRRLALVIEDTNEADSGAKAVTAYQRLRAKGIRYFIGPSGTPGAMALAPILASDKEALIITPSVGVESFHKTSPNIFNTRGTDEQGSILLAEHAYSQGLRSAAIFSSQQPWEQLMGDIFEKRFVGLGGKVVKKVEPLPTETDLNTYALQIVKAKPDVVFFSTYNLLPNASKALSRLSFQAKKYAAFLDDSRVADSQGSLEGAYYADFPKGQNTFYQEFEKAYGMKTGFASDTSYDAVLALASALKTAKSDDFQKVLAALQTVSFDGATGPFKFDEFGGSVRKKTLWQYKNQKLVNAD